MAKSPSEKIENSEICGIIMPIGAMLPEYDTSHWSDVKRVLEAAVTAAGMQPQIVSDSFETDVIQSRIVHNLYSNPVVICDISGLNPNVMFELGMRLTFKKPVIIVTDDVGKIPFDTRVIEHLEYPRDLHIHKTTEFSQKLSDRISALLKKSKTGTFKSYLEAFGNFEVFQPSTESVPADKYIAERLDYVLSAMRRLESRIDNSSRAISPQNALLRSARLPELRFELKSIPPPKVLSRINTMKGVLGLEYQERLEGNPVMSVTLEPLASARTEYEIRQQLKAFLLSA